MAPTETPAKPADTPAAKTSARSKAKPTAKSAAKTPASTAKPAAKSARSARSASARRRTSATRTTAKARTKAAERSVSAAQHAARQPALAGREWAVELLDVQERAVRSVADYQLRAADSTGLPWVARIARSQADVLVSFTDAYVSAARRLLAK